MAGHSKWANIKHQKAIKDARKGAAYAKFSRDILVAAKIGGPDPEGNFRLKTAIDRAKAAGVPNDNIKRAIEKGSGAGAGDELEAMTYEGYGPGGVAIFIEALTDNRNRTAGDIRSYFNKYNGNLGADGCVAWIFEEKGLIEIPVNALTEDDALIHALEAGARDVILDETPSEVGNSGEHIVQHYVLSTTPTELNTVCQALKSRGLQVLSAEVTRLPSNTADVDNVETAKPLLKLLEALEAHDDVQAVYTNANFDDGILSGCFG